MNVRVFEILPSRAEDKNLDPGWYWETGEPGDFHGPFETAEEAMMDYTKSINPGRK